MRMKVASMTCFMLHLENGDHVLMAQRAGDRWLAAGESSRWALQRKYWNRVQVSGSIAEGATGAHVCMMENYVTAST
jgi:hypothetical protein